MKELKYIHKLTLEVFGPQQKKDGSSSVEAVAEEVVEGERQRYEALLHAGLGETGDGEGYEALSGNYSVMMGDPYDVHCDNQAAIKMSEHECLTSRTKHIDIRASFISEAIKQKLLKISYINTLDNLADVFTKPMARDKINLLLSSPARQTGGKRVKSKKLNV